MENKVKRTGLEIAVIGISCRVPGAQNFKQFWTNLKNGVESIEFLTDDEIKKAGISEQLLKNPNYVNCKGGCLEGKENFDASFFEYTPYEAEKMDPQVRIFHECVWEALENAGYNPYSYDGLIGVYSGASPNYNWERLAHLSENSLKGIALNLLTQKDYLTTRISYKFDLKGPSYSMQAACSTSLVAIHLASRALITGECDIALAGGVTLYSAKNFGYLFQEGSILSPDGHCRAFDEQAKGTIGGEGIGIVVLKTLKSALADGDHIYSIIKSSAINNDGLRKVSFTAPSVKGQFEVIRKALRLAKVEPESIGYIEAHGTGTELGDPIEIQALTKAFNSSEKGFCKIGSVKTNIGHLDSAAGVIGFIKATLAIKNKLIPPSLNYNKPNPKIDFKNSPLMKKILASIFFIL